MPRYAITGGSGFLGRALVDALVASGADAADIATLARRPNRALAERGVRQVVGSVLDAKALAAAFRDAEVVYHLAGRVSRDPADAAALHELHVQGTRGALEAARQAGVRRFVHGSTSGTVGCSKKKGVVAHDGSPYCTAAVASFPYYVSKILAEREALERDHGALEVISLNPSLLLGPGDDEGSSNDDVRKFLSRAIPSVPGGGLSLVDVRDAADAFVAAASLGELGTRYLLGAANMTVGEFFGRLERLSGVRAPRLHLPGGLERLGARVLSGFARRTGRAPEVDLPSVEMAQRFWYIDSSRAGRDLGFSPRPVDETLRASIDDLRRGRG